MFKCSIRNYVDNIIRTPNDSYKDLVQATIDSQWENTTQLYNIKEQQGLPFVDDYMEYEAWVDTISDTLVNTNKDYSNFVRILFRDIDHKQNYKGQYYKLCLDGEHEETYICYDRMKKLSQTCEFKCVRCNNILTWMDKDGNIYTYPCYLGTDISSTNNLINKDGIIPNTRMIILVQANENTKSIIRNQRFMFEHTTTFKVEEINNYMQEQGTDGEVTCVKIYIDYSTILPTDNTTLNVCDYYLNTYKLTIQEKDILQLANANGKLNAILQRNGEIVTEELEWSCDNSTIYLQDDGNYYVMGGVGDETTVTCKMKNNPNIFDTTKITIVEDYLPDKKIKVYPVITELSEKSSVEFNCKVYVEGDKTSEVVACVASGVNSSNYQLTETLDGYKLTNIKKTTKPLQLKFSAENCDDVIMTIKLNGLL